MKQKTVHYRRRKFTVPDWADWITTDANGEVTVHTTEPIESPFFPCWISRGKAATLSLVIDNKCTVNYPEWKDSKKFIGNKANK